MKRKCFLTFAQQVLISPQPPFSVRLPPKTEAAAFPPSSGERLRRQKGCPFNFLPFPPPLSPFPEEESASGEKREKEWERVVWARVFFVPDVGRGGERGGKRVCAEVKCERREREDVMYLAFCRTRRRRRRCPFPFVVFQY